MIVSDFVKKWRRVEPTKRSASQQYFLCPTWLDLAHRKLDEAVANAYGFRPDVSDEDLLASLLELNLEREPAKGKTL